MTPNNNLSVLPFYRSIDEQNGRKSYAYGAIYPLTTPINTVLPFQIIRTSDALTALYARLYTAGGKLVKDISQAMRDTGLKVAGVGDYSIIVYPGGLPMPISQQEGRYYITVTDGPVTWYSDVFTAVNNVSGFTKIEWYDKENLLFDAGAIVYESPKFINRLFVCAEIAMPDYEFEEEGETRDGYFFPEKQLSSKKYKFTMLAPEYLCDVMRLIRMADYIRVTDKYGRVYDCDTFLITPKWQTQGDLASVEVEFTTDTVVKRIGRGYIRGAGDYNIDYNNDYNININQ